MKRYLILFILISFTAVLNVRAAQDRQRVNKIEALKVWKLVDYLQLTDDQADRFLPRFRNFEDDMRNMQRDKNKRIAELARKIKSGKSKGITNEVNKILDIDIMMAQRKKDFFNSVKGIISEEQTAKMIVFEYQFRREIRKMIENRAQMRNNIRRR